MLLSHHQTVDKCKLLLDINHVISTAKRTTLHSFCVLVFLTRQRIDLEHVLTDHATAFRSEVEVLLNDTLLLRFLSYAW